MIFVSPTNPNPNPDTNPNYITLTYQQYYPELFGKKSDSDPRSTAPLLHKYTKLIQ